MKNKTIRLLALTSILLIGCALRTQQTQQPPQPPRNAPVTNSPRQPAQKLDLSGDKLSKLPSYVLDMTGLEELDISDNNLRGALPAEIRHLQNLRVLKAANNAMTGIPAEIGQLADLEVADFSNNGLTGLPYELGNLKKLRTLDLRGNNVSQVDLKIIREKLTAVTILTD